MGDKKAFLIFFTLILVGYSLLPDLIWWWQILVFFSFVWLGLDFRKDLPFLFIVLGVSLGLSTYYSLNRINSLPVFFSYITILVLASSFRKNNLPVLLKGLISGVLVIGGLSVVYTLSKVLFGRVPFIYMFLDEKNNLIIPYFGHAFYGIFLIAVLPYVLTQSGKEKKGGKWKKILVALVIFLLFSFSKMAILIGFFQVLFFYRFRQRPQLKSILLIFLIFILSLVSLIYYYRNPWLKNKVVKPSLPSRLEYWNQGLKAIRAASKRRKLLGYGLATFFDLSNKYQSRPGFWVSSAHNFLLQTLIESGLISLLALVGLIIKKFLNDREKYYSWEKATIVSLIFYSLGATYDLVNTFPILLFFILLISNKRLYKSNSLRKNRGINPGLIFLLGVLLFFWFRFLFAYSYFLLSSRPGLKLIKIFPYESSFWEVAIDNSKTRDELLEIKRQLKKSSLVNIEIEKKIAKSFFSKRDYCQSLIQSKAVIEKAPFDLDISRIFITSLGQCKNYSREDIINFLARLEGNYNTDGENLYQMRNFLDQVARYLLENKKFVQAISWFDKTWRADPWNRKRMEIDLISQLSDIDSERAAMILRDYLIVKETTNFKRFDKIRLKTAKEWIYLARLYQAMNQLIRAKAAYLRSIETYPFRGETYFQYGRFLVNNPQLYKKEDIEKLYKKCRLNFDNALWCGDIMKTYYK